MIKNKVSNIRIAIICSSESEDMDVVIPYDIWKRAGIIAETISNEKKNSIFLQCGTKITCNEQIDKVNLDKFNAIYLPGGKGYERLLTNKNDKVLNKIIKFSSEEEKKWVFASGEASVFLHDIDALKDKKVTVYPGYEDRIGKNFSNENIVVSKNIITFKSAFYAFDFALMIVEKFLGKQIATNVAQDILYSKN
ncbi:MAG: DJ-1/PfpI family protein [Malacoplasma sp.]|nr:DJ-1/PfpI family protein [Malacoplasma sp.]MDE5841883.1 DJ-1/PfpI family protein [Malacoplasma sp.]MDE6082254.1 DJ-1/PfpI family protein [Malacoplasma sp.]MDE7112480.1 DJ-1/PfpI family protein [Malacoplasma sp.]